jgi:hypothetical protein
VAGSCEQGNETSGSMKGGEYLHLLSDYRYLYEGLCFVKLLICPHVHLCSSGTLLRHAN